MKSFDEYVDVARHILRESKKANITPEEIIKSLENDSQYTLGDWSVEGLVRAIRYVQAIDYDNDEVAL